METPFFSTSALEADRCHVKVVEFQTNLPCVSQGAGAILRNLYRLLDTSFRRGKFIAFPVSVRQVEEEERIEWFLAGRLLNKPDTLLVILLSPRLLGFAVEPLDHWIRFIRVWLAHSGKYSSDFLENGRKCPFDLSRLRQH